MVILGCTHSITAVLCHSEWWSVCTGTDLVRELHAATRLGSFVSLFQTCAHWCIFVPFWLWESSLSVQSFVRVGSNTSLFSPTVFDTGFSILGLTNLGSFLSLQSMMRLGSGVSLYARFWLGSDVSLFETITFTATNKMVWRDFETISFFVQWALDLGVLSKNDFLQT